jgi:hypothetical protein
LPFPDQTFHKDSHEVLNVKKKSGEIWNMIDSLLGEIIKKSKNIFIVSDHGLGSYRYYANPFIPLIEKTRKYDLFTSFFTINDKLSLFFKIPTRFIIRSPQSCSPRALCQGIPTRFIIRETIIRRYFNVLMKRNELYKLRQEEAWKGYEIEMDKLGITYDMVDPYDVWVSYFLNDKQRALYMKLIDKDEISKYIKIVKTEDLFKGSFYPEFPSAIIMPKFIDKIYLDFSLQPLSFSRLRFDLRSNHHIYGVFIAYGEKVDNREITLKEPLTNYDITPTILSSLGLPIPKGTDGKSLIENNQYYPYDIAIKIKKIK